MKKIMELQKCSAALLCQASLTVTSRNYAQPKQAWQAHNFAVLVSCVSCAVYGKSSKDNWTTCKSSHKYIYVICKYNANQRGMLLLDCSTSKIFYLMVSPPSW